MEATIIAGIIGASATAMSGAASIAANQANIAKGNLSATFEVFNGTSYPLVPVLSLHRHGALFGGIEGEFTEAPGEIDPRKIEVFSVQNTATTDTIGLVLYQSPVFDFLIGWHLFDQGKIWRYLTVGLFEKGYAYAKLPKTSSDWGAFFSGGSKWANDLIWSGTARTHDDVVHSSSLRLHGRFVRGEIEQLGGATKLDSSGDPIIDQKLMYGTGRNINFSSVGYGAAKTMKIYLSDTGRLDLGEGRVNDAVSVLDANIDKSISATTPDITLPAAA